MTAKKAGAEAGRIGDLRPDAGRCVRQTTAQRTKFLSYRTIIATARTLLE